MLSIHLVCLLLACILFFLSAIGVPSARVNLTAAGLCFFTLAFLFTTA